MVRRVSCAGRANPLKLTSGCRASNFGEVSRRFNPWGLRLRSKSEVVDGARDLNGELTIAATECPRDGDVACETTGFLEACEPG